MVTNAFHEVPSGSRGTQCIMNPFVARERFPRILSRASQCISESQSCLLSRQSDVFAGLRGGPSDFLQTELKEVRLAGAFQSAGDE